MMQVDLTLVISLPTAIAATGHIVLRMLPLVSDRVNKRAVRIAKAKQKR